MSGVYQGNGLLRQNSRGSRRRHVRGQGAPDDVVGPAGKVRMASPRRRVPDTHRRPAQAARVDDSPGWVAGRPGAARPSGRIGAGVIGNAPGWHEGSIFLPTEPGGAASPDSTEADWQRAGRQGCAGRTNSRSTRTGGPGPRRRPRMCCTTSGLGPNPDMRFGRKPGVRSSGTPGLEPAELAARVRHGATGQQFAWPTLGGWSCNEIRWM